MAKKKQFEIGRGKDKKAVHCDVERLFRDRMLICANSGGGKSRTLRRILEQTHGIIQHLVIDPEGEYYTLREKFDYVLFGGDEADVQIDLKMANLLPRKLMEIGMSAILDLSELQVELRPIFLKRLIISLLNLPKGLRKRGLLITLDEAHLFAPEGAKSESASAVIQLMSQGRKRGLVPILATQRVSKLAKSAVAEVGSYLIGRMYLPNDVNRSGDMLGMISKQEKHALRQLQPGEFFCFGSALGVETNFVKIGSVVTTHPEPGKLDIPVAAPKGKVKKVLAELSSLPQKAEQEIRDIEGFKSRIRELERQLKQGKGKVQTVKETVTVEVIPEEYRRLPALLVSLNRKFQNALSKATSYLEKKSVELDNGVKALNSVQASVLLELKQVGQELPILEAKGRSKRGEVIRTVASSTKGRERSSSVPPSRASTSARAPSNNGNLVEGQWRILRALKSYPRGLNDKTLRVLSQFFASTGTFSTYKSALNTAGLIAMEGRGGLVTYTEEALALPGFLELQDLNPEEIREWWKNNSKLSTKLMEFVIESYLEDKEAWHSLHEVAEATGFEMSGTFSTYISALNTSGMIEKKREGNKSFIRASRALFPEDMKI